MANLRFQKCRSINHHNYRQLDPVHREQMAISAQLGFGKKYTTTEDFLAQSGDGAIEQGGVELWEVVDASTPTQVLYDCWIYLADTANVFVAGTAQDTGIGMIQWSFGVTDPQKGHKHLADDLQKAFDNR